MSAIVNSIPLAAYPLGLGLLTTSSIFFGNIGLTLTGPLPIIKGELGETGLNGKQKLRVWQAFFDEATVSFLPLTPNPRALWLTISEIHSRRDILNFRSASSGSSSPPYTES